MSLQRLARPLYSTARAAVQTSQPSHSRTSPICQRCLRTIYTRQSQPQTSRRRFASATAQQPQDFESPPPPRNAGIPDTSIAGGKPGVDFAQQPPQSNTTSSAPGFQPANISIPESEAQQSKPVPQSTSAAVGSVAAPSPAPGSSQQKPQRKSKLRPRKAAMTLSPAAVAQLRELLNQPEPKLIRVGVKNRGCSGLAYHLEYVEKPGAFDEAVDQDGVKVLVDSKALFSIIGSEMDWVEDKLSRRFVFKNPNITEQCGCGESFSIS